MLVQVFIIEQGEFKLIWAWEDEFGQLSRVN